MSLQLQIGFCFKRFLYRRSGFNLVADVIVGAISQQKGLLKLCEKVMLLLDEESDAIVA